MIIEETELRVRFSRDVTIAGQLINPRHPKAGHLSIFVPGVLADRRQLMPLASALVEEGEAVAIMDPIGSGLSSKSRNSKDYELPKYRDYILTFLDAARQQLNSTVLFHGVGFSLGSFALLFAAAENPGFNSLTLLGSGASATTARTVQVSQFVGKIRSAATSPTREGFCADLNRLGGQIPEGLTDDEIDEFRDSLLAYTEGVRDWPNITKKQLRKIRTDTLLIVGYEDKIMRGSARWDHRNIRNSTLLTVPGPHGAPLSEQNRSQVVSSIMRWK